MERFRSLKRHQKVRRINAYIAAVISLLFVVHAFLGIANIAFGPIPASLKWLVWAGVLLICMHMAVCARCTYDMWTDQAKPITQKKKRHMYASWTTGALIIFAAILHVTVSANSEVLVLVVFALFGHVFLVARSLLSDFNIKRIQKRELRIAVCVLGAGLIAFMGVAFWL